MASRKHEVFDEKLSMVDTDQFAILDLLEPDPAKQNKRITKPNAFAGLAQQTAVDAVQANLDTHTGTGAGTAHPDGVTQTDLSNHKTAANQHLISGVTGLQTALDEKANSADLGTAATRDVGTLPTEVAAGDAPGSAVSTHETTYTHGNLPTTAQKAALDGNPALGGGNVVPGRSELPSADQQAAMDAANAPSGTNAFATMLDVQGGGWTDGTVVTDWGLTEQALGNIDTNVSPDLDNGHSITGTLTGDRTINFVSGRLHAATAWTCTLVLGGFTPTWQYGGAAIDLPEGYDISGSPSRVEFSFVRTSLGVSVSERKIA